MKYIFYGGNNSAVRLYIAASQTVLVAQIATIY